MIVAKVDDTIFYIYRKMPFLSDIIHTDIRVKSNMIYSYMPPPCPCP